MKLKEGFILRKIAGEDMVIPIGDNIANFNGVIKLNESAAFLWGLLKDNVSEEKLIESLIDKYSIDKEIARNDVKEFISILNERSIIEEI